MEYLEIYSVPWKKFADVKGRARRKEYWTFVLINFLISLVLGVIDGALGLNSSGVGVLGGLFSLASLVPGIAVGVRRLHDTGRSGWWLLIAFIPLVGALILLYFFICGSQPEKNQYDVEA